MKKLVFLIAFNLVSSGVHAQAWNEVQDAGCLTLVIALEDDALLRPDVVTYLTGLWDGILTNGRFDEREIEREYWAICKNDPGSKIVDVLPLAVKQAENLP